MGLRPVVPPLLLSLVLIATPLSRDGATAADRECVVPEHLTITGLAGDHVHFLVSEVLREAYRRLGCEVRFEYYPGNQSLIWANQGISDGDVARIAGTEDVTDLVRVPTPVYQIEQVAFTKSVKRPVKQWGDLKGLSIGVVEGIRITALATEGLERMMAKDIEHLFRLLVHDRVEVVAMDRHSGELEIARHFSGSGIHVLGQPLSSMPLYHMLNRRHEKLVPLLDAVLREMAAKGEIEALQRAAILRLHKKQ